MKLLPPYKKLLFIAIIVSFLNPHPTYAQSNSDKIRLNSLDTRIAIWEKSLLNSEETSRKQILYYEGMIAKSTTPQVKKIYEDALAKWKERDITKTARDNIVRLEAEKSQILSKLESQKKVDEVKKTPSQDLIQVAKEAEKKANEEKLKDKKVISADENKKTSLSEGDVKKVDNNESQKLKNRILDRMNQPFLSDSLYGTMEFYAKNESSLSESDLKEIDDAFFLRFSKDIFNLAASAIFSSLNSEERKKVKGIKTDWEYTKTTAQQARTGLPLYYVNFNVEGIGDRKILFRFSERSNSGIFGGGQTSVLNGPISIAKTYPATNTSVLQFIVGTVFSPFYLHKSHPFEKTGKVIGIKSVKQGKIQVKRLTLEEYDADLYMVEFEKCSQFFVRPITYKQENVQSAPGGSYYSTWDYCLGEKPSKNYPSDYDLPHLKYALPLSR